MANMLNQHLWTTFYLAQAFVPRLTANKWGRIIMVSSPFASQPAANGAPYAAAKAAQEALIMGLPRRSQLGRHSEHLAGAHHRYQSRPRPHPPPRMPRGPRRRKSPPRFYILFGRGVRGERGAASRFTGVAAEHEYRVPSTEYRVPA